tara:strand:- start:120 stop:479 length:360 start_codon:yes stop_codon:yes gene_type:complete
MFVLMSALLFISQDVQGGTSQKILFSLSGKGNRDTNSFRLSDRKVRMVAKTWGGSQGTFSSIELKSEDGKRLTGNDLNIMTRNAEEGYGETVVRGIERGDYYIHVISGVNWTVVVYKIN